MTFGPQNANAATAMPQGIYKKRYVGTTWVKDASAPGAADGTVLDAAFYNRIIGSLDYLVAQSGITANQGDFSVLYRAVIAVIGKGATAALDTIKELGDALNNDANFGATVAKGLANRIRFDEIQNLTPSQKTRARGNLGLAALAVSGSYSDLKNKPAFGTAALLNAGLAEGNLVQLDSEGALPAVSGENLTGIVASSVAWSDITGKPSFGTAATLNVGTGNNNVVQLDGTGKLPAVDGSQLTNLPSVSSLPWGSITGKPSFATVATTGAYSDLSGKPSLGTAAALNVGTGSSNVVQLDGSGRLPAVDGSQLTNLPGGGESVGVITFHPGTAAPTGKLKANGALLSRTTYAALWAYAQSSGNLAASDSAWSSGSLFGQFSPGDGSTTFRIPYISGYFVRAWDDSRGVDSGRTIGSSQADDNKAHTHTTANLWTNSNSEPLQGGAGINFTRGSTVTSSSSGGTEARPKNIALLACIKY